MRGLLIGLAAPLAALIVTAAPAQAQFAGGFSSGSHASGGSGHRRSHDFVGGGRGFVGNVVCDDRRGRHRGDGDGRRHRRSRDCVVFADGGLGYLDPGDYDANRSFDADKWNDWWHERPHRAFPRWVSNNERCERMWWSGGGWRC